jgi:nitric oxide reductase subunit C
MEAQPTGVEGRRQMPNFNLSDEQIRDLANFLIWTDKTDTQDWPPNDAG